MSLLAVGAVFALPWLLLIGALQYLLGPKADWVESMRHRWWLRIHEALSAYGGYAKREMHQNEYVTTAITDTDTLEKALYRANFHRNPLAAQKYFLEPNGEMNLSSGSWVYRPSLLATYQLHLTLFETKSGVEIYSHCEYSNVTHPIKHYRGAHQENAAGKSRITHALRSEGVSYYSRP